MIFLEGGCLQEKGWNGICDSGGGLDRFGIWI